MKKKIYLWCIILITSVILSACGSPSGTGGDSFNMTRAEMAPAAPEEAYGGTYDMISVAEAPAMGRDAGMGSAYPEVKPQSEETGDLIHRKLIKDANLDVETEEFDALLSGIEERVADLGGYMENFNVSNNSRYGGNENRFAHMSVRIPARNYDFFMKEVAAIANVLNRNESIRDVTLHYVDLESRKKVLTTEQDRLIELLAKAETIEDIILLERRLSEVRYEIESMESQLRTYDNLVDYSTIYLSISEVKQLTPVVEQTAWEKISAGFKKSLKDIGEGFVNFFIGLIISLPYLAVIALIIALVIFFWIFVIRFVDKRVKKKKAKQLPSAENNEAAITNAESKKGE